jgi:hypothetical protein
MMRKGLDWEADGYRHQRAFPCEKVANDQALVSELGSEEFSYSLAGFGPHWLNPIYVGQVLR